jgi:pre-mRNA-processing factor 39
MQAGDEDEFEKWEALVTRVSNLEGGVTRNSSPSAIELLRNVYDCFLAKFPYFFGYWKKYADLEFSIGGTETAEMVCLTLHLVCDNKADC